MMAIIYEIKPQLFGTFYVKKKRQSFRMYQNHWIIIFQAKLILPCSLSDQVCRRFSVNYLNDLAWPTTIIEIIELLAKSSSSPEFIITYIHIQQREE